MTNPAIKMMQIFDISIRTPAWGVTGADGHFLIAICISIRTPAWGVTSVIRLSVQGSAFQFAPPRGG